MKAVTQNDLTKNVSHILDMVQQGEEVLIRNEHDQETIAVIVSYAAYRQRRERPLGILKGKARCTISQDFTITDEELLTQ